MCRRLIYLISLIVVLSLAGNASADLAAYWAFDEGSGDIAYDLSGNGNDGILHGAEWGDGKYGKALHFNGQDNYVEVPTSDSLEIDTNVTIAAWINWIDAGDAWQGILSKGTMDGPGENYALFINRDGRYFHFVLALDVGRVQQNSPNDSVVPNEWQHVCCTWDGSVTRIYINGEMAVEMAQVATIIPSVLPLRIGHRDGSSHYWNGIIDELRVCDHVISEAEVLSVMLGQPWPYAFGPDPADGAMHADTWATLSWKPGQLAASHDVYLGENFDDVNAATNESATFQGNQEATFFVVGFPGFPYPDGLVPGTTYYWRIDEVNEANPESPWKGDVWSFSIPPKTAYNPDPADGAEFADPNTVKLSWTAGFGAILHTVYVGDDYDEVDSATGGTPQGVATYSPGPLEREKVYYWRVDEFDAIATHKGAVWSFTTPGAVGNPQPSYSATDIGMNAILSWTPSDSAASHEVYFGTDGAAVRSADTGAPEYKGSVALDAESYDPGLLEADTAYYWRVDEVDAQGNTAKGPLWIFTTGAFLLVDDFEGYTDDDAAGEAIWQAWIDGFGVADNGAQVGNLMPPYAEQTIVHGGAQSMPLLYVNEAGVANSEAAMTLTAPRDWTASGVSALGVWFVGIPANAAEPMYVAIANSGGAPAVVAHEDPGAALVNGWTQWTIPLQAFADQGINLSNVDKIMIGLGSKAGAAAGGSGTVYVDDIRLSR